jgi:hypothetical protein
MAPASGRGHPGTSPSPPVDASLTPAQRELHDGFVASVQTLRTDLVRTMLLLAAVAENRLHRTLGFKTMAEYTHRFAGFTPRQTRDMLQLGRKLRSLHLVAEAIDSGRLPWTKAREICRVATPEDQQEYIDLAQSVSRRTLHEVLSGRIEPTGEETTPPSPPTNSPAPVASPAPPRPPMPSLAPRGAESAPAPDHCYVTLRFTPEQHARWTALLERSNCGGATEERLIDALATPASQGVLEGPSYLVVILHCPRCGADAIVTSRGEAPADVPLVAAGHCDGVIEDSTGRQRATIAPRLRRMALQRARHRCEAAGCLNTRFLEVHHRHAVSAGGGDDLDNLVVLCARCHRAVHEAEQHARDDARSATGMARDLCTRRNCHPGGSS